MRRKEISIKKGNPALEKKKEPASSVVVGVVVDIGASAAESTVTIKKERMMKLKCVGVVVV